jgi:hemolysin III
VETLRDPVSSGSHFLMAIAAIVVGLFLVRLTRQDASRRFPVVVFVCCSIALYLASGLYHALRLPQEELRFFQLIDMSAIYFMVAGSATPLAMILLRGRARTILLAGEWSAALVGVISLWVLPKPPHFILVGCYLSMAWFGCAFLGYFWRATGWAGIRWLVTSLVIYVSGAVMDVLNWPVIVPGVLQWHEMLHLCDLVGTIFYVVFLIKYVIPYQAPDSVLVPQSTHFAAPAQV